MIHNSGLIGKINLIKIFILFYFIKKYIFKYNNCITIVYDAIVSYYIEVSIIQYQSFAIKQTKLKAYYYSLQLVDLKASHYPCTAFDL